MKVIGRMISNMVKVSSIGLIVHVTRETTKTGSSMAKVNTPSTMDQHIPDVGKKTRCMVMVRSYVRMERSITACFKRMIWKVMDS